MEHVAEGTATIFSEWRSPPITIELIKTVSIASHCRSVHIYNGITYIGGSTGVKRVNRNYEVYHGTFLFCIEGGHLVFSISVHNDRIYTLSSDSTVRVHELKGRFITSWTHTDESQWSDDFVIVNNQIAIPDRLNRTLVFYSLKGGIASTLPCPLLNTYTHVCLSAADNNSVIISQFDSSLVYKVDTSSGDIIWQCKEVTKPRGGTCYRDEFVLVAADTKPIWSAKWSKISLLLHLICL